LDEGAMVRQGNRADIDKKLFSEWLSKIVIPYIANLPSHNRVAQKL
jgi:hypothetical protein